MGKENKQLTAIEEELQIFQEKLNERDIAINELIKEHNELVREHNELIKEHNEMVREHNELIKDHNELMKKYNKCEDKFNKLEEEQKEAEKNYQESLHKIVVYLQSNDKISNKNKNAINKELTLDFKLLSTSGYIIIILLLCKSMNFCKINNEKFRELCENKTILYQIKQVFNILAHNPSSLPGVKDDCKMTALFDELKDYYKTKDYDMYEALVNIENNEYKKIDYY